MKFFADFHIHSHFSIATSKQLVPEYLDAWARIKGLSLVGTGDISHPGWLAELEEKLETAEEGLFRLKDDYRLPENSEVGSLSSYSQIPSPRFILTGEISSIYKKNDKVRKVHSLIFLPGLEEAKKLQSRLERIGNIRSDGRPILGLDAKDLLEISLEISDASFFVPAHIWTPWFSMLGAKSGFDDPEECFEDLSRYIYAVETGLSSDPPMNWICSLLDRFSIISNSDAHSPEKLAREANILDTELNYPTVVGALSGDGDVSSGLLGTLEFFPEEGKYHYDGHRKCGVRLNPLESLEAGDICPVCGKKVTVGVLNRVAQLSNRPRPEDRPERLPYYSLIPLKEILSEVLGVGPNSKKVAEAYRNLIVKGGSELQILAKHSIKEIESLADDTIAEGIRRMRSRKVFIEEGFDGEFGKIRVFRENEVKARQNKLSLFSDTSFFQADKDFDGPAAERPKVAQSSWSKRPLISFDISRFQAEAESRKEGPGAGTQTSSGSTGKHIESLQGELFDRFEASESGLSTVLVLRELSTEQRQAAVYTDGPQIIIAGPGSGKTRTIIAKTAYLVSELNVDPESVLVITFTNKAALELTKRCHQLIGPSDKIPFISTFHGFGSMLLHEYEDRQGDKTGCTIIDSEDRKEIIKHLLPSPVAPSKIVLIEENIRKTKFEKQFINAQTGEAGDEIKDAIKLYQEYMKTNRLLDFDDLIAKPIEILQTGGDAADKIRSRFQYLLVDEFQDLNKAQYRLLTLLMPDRHAHIAVIGDPNQSIYGFRGGSPRFFDMFQSYFPKAEVFRLNSSYRNSRILSRASGQIMARAKETRTKQENRDPAAELFLETYHEGIKIRISDHPTDKSEAEYIARTIEDLMGGLRSFSMDSGISEGNEADEITTLSDIAVLVRTQRQMSIIEKAFDDHAIPYRRTGAVPFFKQQKIKRVLRLLEAVTAGREAAWFAAAPNNFLLTEIGKLKCKDFEEARGKITKSNSLKERIRTAWELLDSVKENEEDRRNLERLLDLSSEFGEDIHTFINYTLLGKTGDDYHNRGETASLSTLHASKGLEWKAVFIAGCEDGLVPFTILESHKADFEEERRLFYVGVTRAKTYLFLTKAKRRTLFGKHLGLAESPFLRAIGEEITECIDIEYEAKNKNLSNQLDLF